MFNSLKLVRLVPSGFLTDRFGFLFINRLNQFIQALLAVSPWDAYISKMPITEVNT